MTATAETRVLIVSEDSVEAERLVSTLKGAGFRLERVGSPTRGW